MTEHEFVTALKALGGTDVQIRRQPFDFGTKHGVAAQCRRAGDGRAVRYAIRLAPEAETDEALPALLAALGDKIAF